MDSIFDKYIKGDKVIWTIVILLSLFSIVMAYSSSSNLAYRLRDGDAAPFLFKHITILILGILLMVYLQFFNFKYLSRLSQLGIYVCVLLLLVTLIFGVNKGNASRWIMGFQPSDLAKIILIIYVARVLVIKKDKIKSFKEGLLPVFVPIILVCGLILPADFSTALLISFVCFTLVFVAGARLSHLLLTFGSIIVLVLMLILINKVIPGVLPRVGTWETRIESFFSGKKQDNYQAQIAKRAVVSGFLQGKGPGNGNVKNELYSAQSDFVYSSSIEEFGSIIGGIGLMFLYLIILFRSIRIMTKSSSLFGGYIAFGLSFMLVFQALVNMGVGVSLLPVTGQPLPLISMGGTSILFTCISIGIILNVSRTIESDES